MSKRNWIILGIVVAVIIIIIIVIVVVSKKKKNKQNDLASEETSENIAVVKEDAANPDIKEGEQISVVLDEEEKTEK